MVFLVYFIIVIFANTIGAISGMGGGVIIKPLFDFAGFHSLDAINFYSSVAVFSMAISSTIKQIKNGIQISVKKVSITAVGAIVGGIIGDVSIGALLKSFQNDKAVQMIQNSVMIVLMLLILLYNFKIKKQYHCEKLLVFAGLGVVLGFLSTFLGVGGGPFNVTALLLFVGLEIKTATTYSIIIIFFSQVAKLGSVALSQAYQHFDLSMLLVIIPSALAGGYLGGYFSKKLNPKAINVLFNLVVLFVLSLNVYNFIHASFAL
jgi:uncharacterized membrane protein YfcA